MFGNNDLLKDKQILTYSIYKQRVKVLELAEITHGATSARGGDGYSLQSASSTLLLKSC